MSNTFDVKPEEFFWSKEDIDQWFDALNNVGQQTIRKMTKHWISQGFDETGILNALNTIRTLVEEEKLDINNHGIIPGYNISDVPGIHHEPTHVDKVMMAGWTKERLKTIPKGDAGRLEFASKMYPKYYQRLWEETLPKNVRARFDNIRGENCNFWNKIVHNFQNVVSGQGDFLGFDDLFSGGAKSKSAGNFMKFAKLSRDYMRGKQEARIIHNMDNMGKYQDAGYRLQYEAAKQSGINVPSYLHPDSIR